MSIICYTGLPGSGKSYSVVENVVIPALKSGRIVAHNLSLNDTALGIVCDGLKPEQLVEIPRDCTPQEFIQLCPLGAVVVIDEVWRYWPAGIKASEVPLNELKFFKEHRHRVGEAGVATEIVVVDQDPKTGVPAFLRALIEATYVHEKMSKVGAKGSFRVDVYARCQGAERPSKGALIRKLAGRYKPEVWNCYVSHTQAKRIGEAGLELAADGRASVWKSWTVRAAIAGVALFPVVLWWASDRMSQLGTSDDHAAVTTKSELRPLREPASDRPALGATVQPGTQEGVNAHATAELGDAATEPQAIPLEKPQAPNWTVLGVLTKADGTGIALLRSSLGTRRVKVQESCYLDPLNWVCEVDGEVSAPWTGSSWRTYSRVDPL
ncbi:MAG: zonular occludens toxin domain-containing protein [Panacagrimonas sp.]